MTEIVECPVVFQTRSPVAWQSTLHVKELAEELRGGKPLDAVTVFWAGRCWLLIDGHHRMAAYREAAWRKAIPVKVFKGSLDQAIGHPLSVNRKAQLRMGSEEKSNAAWRVTCTTNLSPEELQDVSGRSRRTIFYMMGARKKLAEDGFPLDTIAYWSWARAWSESKGEAYETKEWDDSEVEKQARELAAKMTKLFGERLRRQPQIVGRALEIWNPSIPGMLAEEWMDRLEEEVLREHGYVRHIHVSDYNKLFGGAPEHSPEEQSERGYMVEDF